MINKGIIVRGFDRGNIGELLMTRRNMLRIFLVTFFVIWAAAATAADGFREFNFGDSLASTQKKGEGLCRFGEEKQNTRWTWISETECIDYSFKGKIKVKLLFQFADDELVKIFVISKDIKDYIEFRYSNYNYLVPILDSENKANTNMSEQRLIQDKVHQLGDEYRYTTFFHNGKWEWEYYYEKKGYRRQELTRREKQLEKENELGVEGWKKFKFGDNTSTLKDKLEGMCSSLEVVSGDDLSEMLTCKEFSFLNQKIDVLFLFQSDALAKIELILDQSMYQTLLPLMKKKYGAPYLELVKNQRYHPYIEFPASNVVLVHKKRDGKVATALKYLRTGYKDADRFKAKTKDKNRSSDLPKKGKTEMILDSI